LNISVVVTSFGYSKSITNQLIQPFKNHLNERFFGCPFSGYSECHTKALHNCKMLSRQKDCHKNILGGVLRSALLEASKFSYIYQYVVL